MDGYEEIEVGAVLHMKWSDSPIVDLKDSEACVLGKLLLLVLGGVRVL